LIYIKELRGSGLTTTSRHKKISICNFRVSATSSKKLRHSVGGNADAKVMISSGHDGFIVMAFLLRAKPITHGRVFRIWKLALGRIEDHPAA
jgi:hypothetical protein